jgi:hypothetical protein
MEQCLNIGKPMHAAFIKEMVNCILAKKKTREYNDMIPEHRSMQAQQPHQMSKMEQVLLAGINLDHRLEHHQHLSIPV